jgi:serine/threonine protein kinase
MKVQQETRTFYTEIERLFKKKSAKLSGGSSQTISLSPQDPRSDLKTIRNIIFNELDELFVPFCELEVGKLIGKGATSEVYIGQFKFSQVAVKKVRLASLAPKQLMNIVFEMKFLRKMRHPNIITMYGVTIDQSLNAYIITELCEQQSLKSFFRKFKDKIPNKVKHKIIFDIAKSLNHIHSDKPGLIHRDIKPENIFLTSDLKAKLGDFG